MTAKNKIVGATAAIVIVAVSVYLWNWRAAEKQCHLKANTAAVENITVNNVPDPNLREEKQAQSIKDYMKNCDKL